MDARATARRLRNLLFNGCNGLDTVEQQVDACERALLRAVADERERCARLAESADVDSAFSAQWKAGHSHAREQIAERIRAALKELELCK